MKKIFPLILLLSFLNSCQTVSEGFQLKKKNNADEFLVEKKNPLVLPPNYNDLPTPESVNSSSQSDVTENFENTIKKSSSKKNDNSEIKSSSTEESILKNIKKDESN